MILVLGGTTEGRLAVQTLEEAGSLYYYSTKRDEQEVALCQGVRLTGGMDGEAMRRFCRTQGIRLLVDAAHPFAVELHRTVHEVAVELGLPVIRWERWYATEVPGHVVWCRDYEEVMEGIRRDGLSRVLCLTGVQTIARLAPLWQSEVSCFFRILNRDSSRELAARQGFPMERLCYYQGEEADEALLGELAPQAIVLKESGQSGGFDQKVAAAGTRGIRVYAVKRPPLPDSFIRVDGPHGLRRKVEQLLPEFYPLHSGITTGTCACAASVAAVRSWLGCPTDEVEVCLPNGETIEVPVQQEEARGRASVVKEAGDDPDITQGIRICAEVQVAPGAAAGYEIRIDGGEGVGRVTLPGLGLPVGGPAINVKPREMMEQNVRRVLRQKQAPAGVYRLVISIPEGRERAVRTFNPRLGVVDGLSIVGTSGIVKPFSSEAFVQSIRKSMEVAVATGSAYIVLNSGAKSERYLRAHFPELPVQAFVHYGNYIGETLKIAAQLQVARVQLGMMMGKAVKLAEGHLDTHSKHTVMNKDFLRQVAREAGCAPATVEAIGGIVLARELWEVLPPHELERFVQQLIGHCHRQAAPLLPEGELQVILISEEGRIYDGFVGGMCYLCGD